MSTITFDTLEAATRLIQAGFTREQAEEAIKVIRDSQSDLATKTDLATLAKDLKLSIGSIVVAGIAVVAAVEKIF